MHVHTCMCACMCAGIFNLQEWILRINKELVWVTLKRKYLYSLERRFYSPSILIAVIDRKRPVLSITVQPEESSTS